MATRNVGLNIPITGDPRGAQGAVRKVKAEIQGLDGAVSKTKDLMAGAFAAYAGASFFQSAISSASDLEESATKVGTVFSTSADVVTAWAENSAKAFGLSNAAALEAAGTYGNLFQAFGLGEQKAASMSMTLVELAADLASFNNTSVEDAIVALRSGLSGETEPLKRYGVALTDARMKEVALAEGIYDGAGALNASQKAQAAYSLIMKDTSKAQGDFTRTSDGLANQQRIMSAEWENAKANLGEGLMPIMKEGVTVVTAFAKAWGAVPSGVQSTALAVGGLALVLPRLAAGAKGAKNAFEMFQLGLAGVTDRNAGAANAFGGFINKVKAGESVLQANVSSLNKVGVAAGAAAAGFAAFAATTALLERTTATNTDLSALAQGLTSVADGGADLAKVLERDLGQSVQDMADNLTHLDRSTMEKIFSFDEGAMGQGYGKAANEFRDLNDALIQMVESGNAEKARKVYGELVVKLLEGGADIEQVATFFHEYLAAQERESESAAGATDDLTDSINEQSDAYAKATKALDDHTKRMESRITTARALEQAELATAQAQQELADLEATAAGRGEEVAQAREAVSDALERERDASEGVRDAQAGLTEAQAGLTEAYAKARDALREKALAAREAADAEAGAVIAADRARKELERARASGADELTIREKSQGVREADTAVVEARRNSEQARLEASKSVEQDEGVINARKAVADANRGVRDAERQLTEARKATGEAERAVSKVISDAKGKLKEAADKVRDAMMQEASAAGDAAGAQFGAAAGAQEHANRLNDLIKITAPGSPLRQNLEALRQALGAQSAYDQGSLVASGSMSLAAAESSIRSGPRALGGLTIVVQGTPQQQRRAVAEATGKELDKVARGGG